MPSIHCSQPFGICWFSALAQRGVDHVVRILLEAIIGKAHALRQLAEHISVGAALAQRLNGLVGYLKIRVAVRLVEVFVLQETWLQAERYRRSWWCQ